MASRPFLISFSAFVGESKPRGSKGNLFTTPDCNRNMPCEMMQGLNSPDDHTVELLHNTVLGIPSIVCTVSQTPQHHLQGK